MKRCPYCAEDIRDEAVRCPHCTTELVRGAVLKRENLLRIVCGFFSIGFGLFIFVGAAVAENAMYHGDMRFLVLAIYDLVLGLGLIWGAMCVWAHTKNSLRFLLLTAVIYIGCTVVNELALLFLGANAMFAKGRLNPGQCIFDIIMWSAIPTLIIALTVLINKVEQMRPGAPSAGSLVP
jgi:hypothetical protein